ncbi:hypothetical protein [Methylobacterium sp. J-092]|uniref:hypothetical protein n=1 Tax=Methylobacterium sp. J-092 TaxID=2836667 RepID=UPI001FB90482|nr:hypothetical protein [Methylobacterium sp. J-092]MCJ2007022.1 hypothetical protein [Methylobacterium sp. J-092]
MTYAEQIHWEGVGREDCEPVGDKILSSTEHTARKVHVCSLCDCAGIQPGDRYLKVVAIAEDDGAFTITRLCKKEGEASVACISATEQAREAEVEAMNDAAAEGWREWAKNQCGHCFDTGLIGTDEHAVACPHCAGKV